VEQKRAETVETEAPPIPEDVQLSFSEFFGFDSQFDEDIMKTMYPTPKRMLWAFAFAIGLLVLYVVF
jgi:hypothetical protein